MFPARSATRRRRAFSLLEVIIASGVLAISVAGAVTAMYASSRMARDARYDIMAMEALNRHVELLKAGDYDLMGPVDPADVGLPAVPNDLVVNTSANFVRGDGAEEPWEDTFNYDEGDPTNAPQFDIDYTWYGFGIATTGSNNSIEVDASGWPADIDGTEFIGSFMVMPKYDNAAYAGGGQVARITGATAAGVGASRRITFALTARLVENFTNDANLAQAVGANTVYFIDGGKWVRVEISWNPPWAEARAAATGGDPEDFQQRRVRDVFIGDPDVDGEEESGS